MENRIRISVRNLIEFSMRSGDIDDSYISQDRAVMGIRAHQKLQEEYPGDYRAEISLKADTIVGGVVFAVEGRVDGIIYEDDKVIIDEIKSTTRPLVDLEEDSNPLHWAQAKCYAYFYSIEEDIEEIGVQLSYYNIDEDKILRFRKLYSQAQLWEFYEGLLQKYLVFSRKLIQFREERNASSHSLEFPFKIYRKGQRKMAVAVYQTIMDKKNLFLEAPTGIGKTMSAAFPSIKAMGEKLAEKIFYLTARGTTKEAAFGALKIMADQGLRIKAVNLNAKERICINKEIKCNPQSCPYAKGHFDRVNQAILEIMDYEDLMDEEKVKEYSLKHQVCPFELQLDLATYASFIVCDYNYAFNPSVYLRRFFDSPTEDYVFLVDEAHNLIDRGRDMYSASLSLSDFLDRIESFHGNYQNIRRTIQKILSQLESFRKPMGKKEELVMEDPPEKLIKSLAILSKELDPFLGKEKNHKDYEEILQFYFKIQAFRRISQLYSESYRCLFYMEEGKISCKLLCIDLAEHFSQLFKRARSSVLFSATLSPMDYYIDSLTREKPYRLHLDSPFNEDNLSLTVMAAVSTRYRDRSRTLEDLVKSIESFTQAKSGNYLIFFPSYRYMLDAYKLYEDRNFGETVVQAPAMSEKSRAEFLDAFEFGGSKVGFAVLGGIFAEGIDLVGNSLIGVAIVSVGLPGFGLERNTIRDYYDIKSGIGYDYAYKFPGMNKVLQAAGRVIRTEDDRGAVLLIDDRFTDHQYREIMPSHWSQIVNLYDIDSLKERLNVFWHRKSIEK